MDPLTYTQQTVAFPTVPIYHPGVTEEISLSLDAPGGGTHGEFTFLFHRFDHGTQGIQLCCYGDGLTCLYDPRVQEFLEAWRAEREPDALSVERFIALLREHGAVPSEYMARASG